MKEIGLFRLHRPPFVRKAMPKPLIRRFSAHASKRTIFRMAWRRDKCQIFITRQTQGEALAVTIGDIPSLERFQEFQMGNVGLVRFLLNNNKFVSISTRMEHAMDTEPVQQSLRNWMVAALGFPYMILLPRSQWKHRSGPGSTDFAIARQQDHRPNDR